MTNGRVFKSLAEHLSQSEGDLTGADGDFRALLEADPLKTEFNDSELQSSFQAACASFLLLSLRHSGDQLKMAFQTCESPIEIHFLSAFICAAAADWTPVQIHNNFIGRPLTSPQEHEFDGFVIKPQHDLAGYRCDFLIEYISGEPDFDHRVKTCDGTEIPGVRTVRTSVIVECDGHDFHEKTKQQAARDKKRDRDIQASGFHILRFSGSEIWKSPVGCAVEVIQFLQG